MNPPVLLGWSRVEAGQLRNRGCSLPSGEGLCLGGSQEFKRKERAVPFLSVHCPEIPWSFFPSWLSLSAFPRPSVDFLPWERLREEQRPSALLG